MDTLSCTGEVIESGVDYLTLTCSQSENFDRLAAIADGEILSERGRGNELRSWKFEGYDGFACGSIQTGRRFDSVIIRASGDVARRRWRDLAPLSTNVSRVDLQLTARVSEDVNQTLLAVRAALIAHKVEHNRPTKIRTIEEHAGGVSVYLGSRLSDSFARLYNKRAESQIEYYDRCLRAEVQYQGKQSRHLAARLVSERCPETAIPSLVAHYLAKRGSPLEFNCGELNNSCPPRMSKTKSKQLLWLATQVKPVLQRLIGDSGGLQVCEALGLSEQVLSDLLKLKRQQRKERKTDGN